MPVWHYAQQGSVCVCVCVCARACTCVCMHIFVCMCVTCVLLLHWSLNMCIGVCKWVHLHMSIQYVIHMESFSHGPVILGYILLYNFFLLLWIQVYVQYKNQHCKMLTMAQLCIILTDFSVQYIFIYTNTRLSPKTYTE